MIDVLLLLETVIVDFVATPKGIHELRWRNSMRLGAVNWLLVYGRSVPKEIMLGMIWEELGSYRRRRYPLMSVGDGRLRWERKWSRGKCTDKSLL